jgi:ATP-binding cassette subfamily F protein 3
LDEPNNHLDMQSIDALIESLQEFPGAALFVTHNERMLRALASRLVVFQRGRVDVFNSTYDDFLEKVGWEDEGDGKAGPKKPSSRNDYREKRELEKAERKKKARLEKLEAEIIAGENTLNMFNEQLVAASNRGNLAQMRELSEKITRMAKAIEDLYREYEG